MTDSSATVWLVFSAGQGPAECALAVARAAQRLVEEAAADGLDRRVVDTRPGPEKTTLASCVVEVAGPVAQVESVARRWLGTVQWTCPSPFRPKHRRKNWFIGVTRHNPVADATVELGDVRLEAIRAGGPGGQHRNKVATGIRLTHKATGLVIEATEERSQLANRRLALWRLGVELERRLQSARSTQKSAQWDAHQGVERGDPVRRFSGPDFTET